jgi:hypothetical protein
MNNECISYFEAAYTQKITVHAAYAITGKTFVGPLTTYQSQGPGLANDPLAANDGGNLIAAAAPTAGGAVSGVAGWDVAINGKCPIIRGAGTFVPVTSGAAVTAGQALKVDTQGRVLLATTGSVIVGYAHSTVGSSGLDVIVELAATATQVLSP